MEKSQLNVSTVSKLLTIKYNTCRKFYEKIKNETILKKNFLLKTRNMELETYIANRFTKLHGYVLKITVLTLF